MDIQKQIEKILKEQFGDLLESQQEQQTQPQQTQPLQEPQIQPPSPQMDPRSLPPEGIKFFLRRNPQVNEEFARFLELNKDDMFIIKNAVQIYETALDIVADEIKLFGVERHYGKFLPYLNQAVARLKGEISVMGLPNATQFPQQQQQQQPSQQQQGKLYLMKDYYRDYAKIVQKITSPEETIIMPTGSGESLPHKGEAPLGIPKYEVKELLSKS